MKKEKATPKNGAAMESQSVDPTTNPTKRPTKRELVACHLLSNGPVGISALSALAGMSDLNARNSISELRRHNGVIIFDEFFAHQHSGGGTAHLKRYWLADRDQARKVAELVNLKRKQRGAASLSREQIARYLAAFPIKHSHQPTE